MEDIIRSSPLVSNCTVIAEGRERAAILVEIKYEIAKEYCLSSILEKGYFYEKLIIQQAKY